MAFSEFELKKCEKAIKAFLEKNRPPAYLRNELDLGFRQEGQSVEIFEMRPRWDDHREKIEIPVAKATYVKSQRVWKVYWQRADLKWHSYEPRPEVKELEEFLALVESDKHACFFG